MKDLNKILNQKPGDEREMELRKAVNQVLNQELKQDFQNSLKQEYGISKDEGLAPTQSGSSPVKKNKLFRLKSIIGIAAAFILFISVYSYFKPSLNISEKARQFAIAEILTHPGISKGIGENELIRREAIAAFNDRKWNVASSKFGALEEQSSESIYYSALANFYNKDYPESIRLFRNDLLSNSVFTEEVNWYLSLALILDNQEKEAQEILSNIKPGEWKYLEAQELKK